MSADTDAQRRFMLMRHQTRTRAGWLIAGTAAATAVTLALPATSSAVSSVPGTPKTDAAGIINLPPGYQYDVLATAGETPVTSTESGETFSMPEDNDANVTVTDTNGQTWLVTVHELTRVREGETFLGDDGKAFVPEQATTDDGDVDGWGSVTRIPLAPNGRHAGPAQVITTGLHNLCAGALTPWGTFLVNEEFPFPGDTQPYRSGFVWEVDPFTGAQTKLTGMGRFSHEQEALAADGAWYLTNDFGNDQFIFRFVPDSPTDLVHGDLFGLAFDKSTGSGTWVGPLDPTDPTADMESRGYSRAADGFSKGEGIVATPDGQSLIFTESGAPTSANPGRIWKFSNLTSTGLTGAVIAEGDFATLSHPDNVRFSPGGDLFIMEDNSSALVSHPETGGMNEIRVLPAGQTGTGNTRVLATLPNGGEPTGPWFSDDGSLLYLSIQGDPSHSIVIRGPETFARSLRH
jgi:secreted PhoX family phosphatase